MALRAPGWLPEFFRSLFRPDASGRRPWYCNAGWSPPAGNVQEAEATDSQGRCPCFIRLGKVAIRAATAVMILLLFSPALRGEPLTIRLLNAESGKGMGNKSVTVTWIWDDDSSRSAVSVDSNGTGRVAVRDGAKLFGMVAGPRTGTQPNRIAYIDCNVYPASTHFSVAQVLKTGIVPKNHRGEQTMFHGPEKLFFGLFHSRGGSRISGNSGIKPTPRLHIAYQ